jgi:hypothetical protein
MQNTGVENWPEISSEQDFVREKKRNWKIIEFVGNFSRKKITNFAAASRKLFCRKLAFILICAILNFFSNVFFPSRSWPELQDFLDTEKGKIYQSAT